MGPCCPQMVVTIGLETDEARDAAQAAREGDGRLVLVPRADGRYSRIGTIARVENSGELGNGLQALVVRGLARGRVGVGSPGASGALHVAVDPIDETTPGPRTRELAREYRALVEELLEKRGLNRLVGHAARASTSPARWPTAPPTGPISRRSSASSCSRRSTSTRGSSS